MPFWGYNNEVEARLLWPQLDEGERKVKPFTVCTPGKNCTGSFDGKEFMYADGSRDYGIEITLDTIKIGDDKIEFLK